MLGMVSSIDLIALDLDGTLLNPDESISPANRAAISAALARGVRVVLVTGRGVDTPAIIARDLGLNLPIICAHGALTKDFMQNKVLGHIPVPLRYARPMIEYAELNRLDVAVYVKEQFVRLEGSQRYMGDQQGPTWRDVASFREIAGHAPTFMRFFGDTAVEAMREAFRDLPLHFKYESWGDFQECAVTSPEATKKRALEQLCADLQVAPARVMAIGDSRNDVPMMRWAGIGVAMANALPEVRSAVAHITESNTDDGVARAIERYVLQPTDDEKKSA